MREEKRFIEGNIAIVEGAIAAGARFYAGYPISPSSEIAEYSSKILPKVGGLYVQMEDEISSMAALLGASVAGKKGYTATSGPGISELGEKMCIRDSSHSACVFLRQSAPGSAPAPPPPSPWTKPSESLFPATATPSAAEALPPVLPGPAAASWRPARSAQSSHMR